MSEKTEFSPQDYSFSQAAHQAAQRMIYPRYFNVACEDIQYMRGIEFIKEGETKIAPIDFLDSWMAIDRILRVPAPVELGYLEFTVQERFERTGQESYRNVTITHRNVAAGNVSELYKLKAHLFVSGYFNGKTITGKTHICNVERILSKVQSGELRYYKKDNHKNQDFLTFGFDDLERVGATICEIDFGYDPPRYHFPDRAFLQEIKRLENEQKITNSLLLQLLNKTKVVKPINHGNVIDCQERFDLKPSR